MDSKEDIDGELCGYKKALLVTLGFRDMMTRTHSERVHQLSIMLGDRCGIRGRKLTVLNLASSFHDVGKIGIPDEILLKPSRLDEEEWAVIKRHPEIGAQIMLSSGFRGHPIAGVARAIRHHHEHYDGSGYPDGLAGEDIPLFSRIIAIADSYDAMAVTRAYHAARMHDEIMAIMHEETGIKFDPKLMQMFDESIVLSPMRVA
jgi:response regulator RpfG family c-di-GMP phosphodiesterase